MAKVLIPYNNTPWGVKKYASKDDEYEHVLSFESEEVKTKYIGKELFNDVNFNYIEAIETSTSVKSFTRLTETTAMVSISLTQIGEEYTLNDLMNVDSLFIKEKGEILLWAVDSRNRTVTANNDTVKFTLSLDVFFNYLDKLEVEGSIHWRRAHTNRHNGTHFLKEDNRNQETILEAWAPNTIEAEEIIKTDGLPSAEAELLSKITFAIVHVSLADNINSGKGSGTEIFYQRQDNGSFSYYVDHLPENIFVFPVNLTESHSSELWDGNIFGPAYYLTDKTGRSKGWGRGSYDKFKNDTNIISIEYVNGASLPMDYKFFSRVEVDTATTDATSPLVRFHFDGEFNTSASDSSLSGFKSTWKHANWYGGCAALRIVSIRGREQYGKSLKLEVPKPELTPYTELRNIKNEVKLHLEVKDYSIEGKNGDPFNFKPSTLNKSLTTIEDFALRYSFQLNPFQSYGWYGFDDSEQFPTSSAINHKFGYKELAKKLPTTSEAWAEYVSTNAWERSNAGVLQDIIGPMIKGTITGGVGGGLVGGPIGAGIGAATGAVTGTLGKWTDRVANKKNLKNTPNTYRGVVDNFVEDMVAENTSVKVVRRGFIKEEEQLLFDMFTEIGYEINRQGKFEDYLNNRYYHNFVQTGSIFSNIKNRLASTIKQAISDTFEKGVTVWHVRDVDTFKGIANYDYENQEINLIE